MGMREVRESRGRRSPVASIALAAALLIGACSGSTGGSGPSEPPGTNGSAVTDPSVTAPPLRGGIIRLSEIHYHSSVDDPNEEFVELANVGDIAVELQEWCIEGLAFCFAESTLIEPGGFVVVRQADISGNISNSGEVVGLRDSLGQIVDEIEYSDEGEWSTDADGGGSSLHRVDFEGFDVEAWEAAPPTPGAAFDPEVTLEAGDVVITEINYHPADDDPGAVFVEIANVSDAPIDLLDWCIRGTGFCWTWSALLGAGDAIAATGLFADGKVSRDSDRFRIVDPDGRVHDTASYSDSGTWPARADGHGDSLHRRDVRAPGVLPGNWDSAPPSPDEWSSESAPLLPIFDEVSFTIAPRADEPVVIEAQVTEAEDVSVAYVVDFGPEVLVDAELDDGAVRAEIPPQPPGSLVRFRLIGAGDALGTWPRGGDGMNFAGTVVLDPNEEPSTLPRLKWFLPDDVWDVARLDTKRHGNEGYPAVVALDGVVFDNAVIRIKGNQARSNKKKKWKVMLPAGHHWDGGGLFRHPVDQFDLLPAATDKSFSREILVSDMQELSGGFSQQVFPLRLERNNEFLGLYMYGESPDGDWRERMGLSDDVYVWKAELVTKLRYGDLSLARDEFARHYERITRTWLDDNDEILRDMIRAVNEKSGDELLRWAFENTDVPQIVEALATMRIVQHGEWQHKNYFVMFDPADRRWRLVPIDFDLTFGRFYHGPCNAKCDDIRAYSYLDYPNQNQLAEIFLEMEPLRSMVDRRTRELSEVYLAEGFIEGRLLELLDAMGPDAELDRDRWGAYGTPQTMARAQEAIVEQFVLDKRRLYIGEDSVLPDPQPSDPDLDLVDVSTDAEGVVIEARLVNGEQVAIDVSNRFFADIGALVPAGVVVPAGGSVLLRFDRAPVTPGGPLEVVVDVERAN